MAGTTASPTNTASQSLDGVHATGSVNAQLKRGVVAKAISGSDTNSLAQEVATHADDAAFAAGDAVVAAGYLADETTTDSVDEGDIGVARMTLDRRPLVAFGNQDLTIFTSAARTATPTPYDGVSYGRGFHLVIDATAITATPSITFTVQGKDVISGKFYTIIASAAVTGISTTILRVYPGLTAAANLIVSDILPHVFRVTATHGDADSITYSVGMSIIL